MKQTDFTKIFSPRSFPIVLVILGVGMLLLGGSGEIKISGFFIGSEHIVVRTIFIIAGFILIALWFFPPFRGTDSKSTEITKKSVVQSERLVGKWEITGKDIKVDGDINYSFTLKYEGLMGTLQNSLPSRLTAGKLGPVQR